MRQEEGREGRTREGEPVLQGDPMAVSVVADPGAPDPAGPAPAGHVPGTPVAGTAELELREFHSFEAVGQRFVYLVPSAAIFRLDEAAAAVLDALTGGPRTLASLAEELAPRLPREAFTEALQELLEVRAVGPRGAPPEPMPVELPPGDLPLSTLVLNVTSKCNLSCGYCYEYGEDRLVDEGTMPRFMDEATARESVEFMLAQAGDRDTVNLTFFGGETLLNFKLLRTTLEYARRRGTEEGKRVRFSLTTNGTLLRPEIIEWLVENEVGVTVSIDGPKDVQDKLRVLNNGAGSYELMAPKVKALLERHQGHQVAARVTLTRENLDIHRIFRHLTQEMGFSEVGFAPVTTSSCRSYALDEPGYDSMLRQFGELARDWLEHAVRDEPHGFSNIRESVQEIHRGFSKAYPCGAGLGLMGVATDGNVSLCHRFAGSAEHTLGSVTEGIDRGKQTDFLEANHIAYKPDCHSCWARPLCSGGCYHEAHTRYGTTTAPNLHYCDWIRSWTHTCLEIYGELAERNPAFLKRLEA